MISQGGPNSLILFLKTKNGWNEALKNECEKLISNLSPDDVLSALSTYSYISKKHVGRPKSYAIAWMKLENHLISYKEFKALVYKQLINDEIGDDTYYRALKRAKNFIAQRKIINITPKSYREAWLALQSSRMSWDEFKAILLSLKKNERITEDEFSRGLLKGEELMKFRRMVLEIKGEI